ncbi:CST complex subunit STN1 [Silene latifolia]|uniref:CST complex subunit STN1 n=1 Tax=Silene latifolia TaxID=37657 RepID=UPI003D77CAE2
MNQNSLLNINVKLLAFDITSLTHRTSIPSSSDQTTFYRKGIRISRVEVAGVVVTKVLKPDKFIRFTIDDGTGCIQCILWLNHLTSPYFSRRCPSDVRCIAQMANLFSTRLQLGQFVKVRGRVSGFRGSVQVTVDDVVAERDPNSEILHWLDCVKLARKCSPLLLTGDLQRR